MTERKRPHANRKWSDADWYAAIEIIATQLQTSLQKMRPDGLPSYFTVCTRARRDSRIKALLAEAIERRKAGFEAAGMQYSKGGGRPAVACGRGYAYSDAAYTAYLEKLKTDQTAKSLGEVQKLYWPGLPTFHSVMRRRRIEMREILRAKGLLKPPGWHLVRNPVSVYSEDVYTKAIGLISTMSLADYGKYRENNRAERLPSYQSIFKRAERDPEFGAKLYSVRPKVERATFRYDDEVYEAAISKIGEAGWSAYLAIREPGVWPSLNAIYKRTRSDADFKARLHSKVLDRYRLKRQLKSLTKNRPAQRPDGQLGLLLLQQDAYRTADRFVPRHYYREDRDDIKQDIVAAVLAGEFELEAIGENAGWFISQHFRGGVFSSRKFSSLDAPIFDDSDVAFVDRLTSDDYSHIG